MNIDQYLDKFVSEMKRILKELEIDPQQFNPRAILAAIGKA